MGCRGGAVSWGRLSFPLLNPGCTRRDLEEGIGQPGEVCELLI
jgi:hypothetical protein